MKKLIILYLLLVVGKANSQVDWPGYSTSFTDVDKPSLGIAIPYNGVYNNFVKNVAGISHWNPGYGLNIDTALDANIPLFFVYDTAGIYLLFPGVNERNANEFGFIVRLNNKTNIAGPAPINKFTQVAIGRLAAGNGIMGSYQAPLGQYLVTHLTDKKGAVISSMVIYFQKKLPGVRSISTSDHALAFSRLLKNEMEFNSQPREIGWHRQYSSSLAKEKDTLRLSYNENNILVQIDAAIYKKESLEYTLLENKKEIRKWGSNEYDNPYILLKDLAPGNYTLRIRLKRQRNSVIELQFLISPVWYKSAGFMSAVFILISIVAISSVLYIKYRRQQQKLAIANKKTEQIRQELRNIQALLNPHFIFNALSSIQGLVNKENIEAANLYLSSFGELLRATLNESNVDHISLKNELNNLKAYIQLEQLRYSFTYNLEADKNIDLNATIIPPFLLQPFVENAIKHGHGSVLTVSLVKDKETMIIKIIDDGQGFDAAAATAGHGLSLSKKRIKLLNKEYGEELIKLDVHSIPGTTITLSFQNWI